MRRDGSYSDHVLPHWPGEVHYSGTGYGAFPARTGGDGRDASAPIEVWYSEVLAAEKLAHAACRLDVVGDPNSRDGETKPCVFLATGTVRPRGGPPSMDRARIHEDRARAYLYAADGSFCCERTGSPEDLSPQRSDFMDGMTVDASRTAIKTRYYDGPATWYAAPLDGRGASWYATTPEGRPLQQGEGASAPDDEAGRGALAYRDYDVETWIVPNARQGKAPFLRSTFAVPAVCVDTPHRCAFPS